MTPGDKLIPDLSGYP